MDEYKYGSPHPYTMQCRYSYLLHDESEVFEAQRHAPLHQHVIQSLRSRVSKTLSEQMQALLTH
jgi:hypothetical protein